MDSGLDLIETVASKAREFGASEAAVIPASSITVEERFAEMCSPETCPGYGVSPMCPPYSMKPVEFRELLSKFEYALVFKKDVAVDVLLGNGKDDALKEIHLLASRLEEYLGEMACETRGFAAGSCRLIFCGEFENCTVLDGNDPCRFPGLPKPSLSGLGVNFIELFKVSGWELDIITSETDTERTTSGALAGLVLFRK